MWKSSVCTRDRPDTCGLLVKVEDGEITQVKGSIFSYRDRAKVEAALNASTAS